MLIVFTKKLLCESVIPHALIMTGFAYCYAGSPQAKHNATPRERVT